MLSNFLSFVSTFCEGQSFLLSSKQAKSQVISSLKNALRLTYKHINETRQGEPDNYTDKESKELSDAWSKVAMVIRPFDSYLAQIFEEKSDYWINPYGFREEIQNGERRFNYKFRLEEVEKELVLIERN
jgi:hypothetical protein